MQADGWRASLYMAMKVERSATKYLGEFTLGRCLPVTIGFAASKHAF